jgi:RNA polymerase sigma-70 factor (ECF subfamily)
VRWRIGPVGCCLQAWAQVRTIPISTSTRAAAVIIARTHLADTAPSEDDAAEPDDAARRELLDRYCGAFENDDLTALTDLLQTDVRLEMPPLPVWFTGRDAVTRFLAQRAFAEYRRAADNVLRAHSIHVITAGDTAIAGIVVFLDPALFAVFGLPPTR